MEKLRKVIEEKEYTLETLLLCTPFESDSDRNLMGNFDANLFFEGGFYTTPCLEEQIKLIEKEIIENSGKSKEIETLKAKKKELKTQLDSMCEFESIIKKCKFSEDMSYIRSFPGSGKTTYLHKLVYDNRKTHKSVVIDFKSFIPELMISNSDYKETIYKTDKVDTKDTLIKFTFLLADVLNDLIIKSNFIGDDGDDSKYFKYLSNLCSNYEMLFSEKDEISDLIKNSAPFIKQVKIFLYRIIINL